MSVTLKNIEQALASESMSHVKYIYFAEICREHGYDDIADLFDETASHEILHALGHLKVLIGNPTPEECLEIAINTENYESAHMYPQFEQIAGAEKDIAIENESKIDGDKNVLQTEHFKTQLAKAKTIFGALTKVEERHAKQFTDKLKELKND
jgi:rubrerythrin